MTNKVTHNKKVPRRTFIKGASLALGTAMFPMISTKAAAKKEINLLAWYGNGEPDMVADFERRNNVKVNSKYYTGGDNMLALLAQSPPGTYDVVLSDAEYVSQLLQANLLQRLDPKDYPLNDFYQEFQRFPVTGFWSGNNLYSVPVSFGFLGLTYNTAMIKESEAKSYSLLWSKAVKGKVGHFDWYLPNMGCLSQASGNKKSPYRLSSSEFGELKKKMGSLRKQVNGFFDYGSTLSSLKNGQVLAMCGIGDWITGVLQKDGAKVNTVIPQEGGIQFTEGLAIAKGSKNVAMAKKLIQYMTSPEGQVRKAIMKAYPTSIPSKAGWELLNKKHPEEAKRARMQLGKPNVIDDIRSGNISLRELPVNQSVDDWNSAWLSYKNS